MSDVYVNRKLSLLDDEIYTQKSTSVDQYETSSSSTDDELNSYKKTEYLSLVNRLMNSANNRDFYSLNQMLVPLVENKNVELLDSLCALHWCCFSGHVDLVNKLLDVGCDPFLPDPINYESPVYYSIKASNSHIISILMKRFGPLILCHENRKSKTPFLVAVSEFAENDLIPVLHVLEFLYLSGVSLEEQDSNGTTALMFACKRGELFVVQWLIKKGADLSHRDHFGATVLHYAALSSSLEVVRFLAQNGMAHMTTIKSLSNDVTTAKTSEQTPLDVCKEKGNHLQYLLLKLCYYQWRFMGRVVTFNTFYPVLYWMISILNFFLFFPMWNSVYEFKPEKNKFFYIWFCSYFITQLLWIMTKNSDPGVSNKNDKDLTRSLSPTNDLKLTPFEGVLESLHRRQQVVNFEFYCINKDFKKNFVESSVNKKYRRGFVKGYSNQNLLDPLNQDYESENPFMSRVNTCIEEMNKIKTEMRSVYPQVANERCNKNTNEYNNAVLNFESSTKVCLTCCKTRAMREHHCSMCNTCLIHQDHHCGWVDICVGSGNQKKFSVFLAFNTFSHLYYFLPFFHYLSRRFKQGFKAFDVFLSLVGFFGNGQIAIFLTYLSLRLIRSMLTDVTYYEFLKKPTHIRAKYKGNVHERFWDFKSLSLKDYLMNFVKFWTYKTHQYESEHL